MTRIYARGNSVYLRSANITEDTIESIIKEYNKSLDFVTDKYNIRISKSLDSLNEKHDQFEIIAENDTVRIGYQTQDAWIPAFSYKINEEIWLNNDDLLSQNCAFDHSLLVIHIEHMDYSTYEEFAINEFVDPDGQNWLEWFKENNMYENVKK